MKYIFFGTPEFSVIILEKLIQAGYIPSVVVCSPDESIGRKKILTSPPTKELANKFNIAVFQPQKLRDNAEFLKKFKYLKPDLAVVAAYGKIIPKEILEIPRHGFINIHPSLLPKYRGASPIQGAVLNGDKETGVTIMKLDEEMDHGGIISNLKYKISSFDTYEALSKKLAGLGATLLIKIIPDFISGKIRSVEQKHSKATYTKIIKKEDGRIDWRRSADEIERMVRAYYPWPMAYTYINLKSQKPKLLKIIESEISKENHHVVGETFLDKSNKLSIKCGAGSLIIKKLQLEGGKILSAQEFLNGHKDFIGIILR